MMITYFLGVIDLEHWSWLLPWLFAFSLIVFIGSIVGVWIVLVRLPEDYLITHRTPEANRFRWTVGHLVNMAARNLAGIAFVSAGIVMLVTPGQGILSIFVGLTLIDFPGKRKLILKILAYPKVLKTINRLRKKAHKPPLIDIDAPVSSASTEK